MKYIKKFANMSEYQAFTEGGGYITPNLCLLEDSYDVVLEPERDAILNVFPLYLELGELISEEFFNSFQGSSLTFNINCNVDLYNFYFKYIDINEDFFIIDIPDEIKEKYKVYVNNEELVGGCYYKAGFFEFILNESSDWENNIFWEITNKLIKPYGYYVNIMSSRGIFRLYEDNRMEFIVDGAFKL